VLAVTDASFRTVQKALAGLRRINLDGLRWRVFDAKGQVGILSLVSAVRNSSEKKGNISGANQPFYANCANFNLGHQINIQGAWRIG